MTKKILVVDDNPDDLDFYRDLLQQTEASFVVLTAETGDEALEMFSTNEIDCTFVDYNLPEMNGLKILELLNKKAGGKILPIIILTGEPNQTVKAEAARKGALNYLVKDVTITPEQIVAIIDKTIEWSIALNSANIQKI